MTIFERIIPFPQRLHWLMLKAAFAENVTAQGISKRLGWSEPKVRQIIWGNPDKLRCETIGEWFFACGGQMPRFTVELL